MDANCTTDDLTVVDADELDLVARLLAAMSPAEDGRHPGAQLARTRSGRVWTITDGGVTVDVRCSGPIRGLRRPVWMTARSVMFAAGITDSDGGCDVRIDDRREQDGTVAALIDGGGAHAGIDLPTQPPMRPLRVPPPASVLATAVVDLRTLLRVVEAASLPPVGVAVSGPPTGTFRVGTNELELCGTDRRGVDHAAEFRLDARIESDISPAVELTLHVELLPLIEIGEHLPGAEAIVTLTREGDLWLTAGPCRLVLRGELSRVEPDEVDGVVFLVGRVEGTGEAVLSVDGSCPVDGVMVWLESCPDEYGRLEEIEELHDIVWYAEPEPYGVGIPEG